MGVSIVSTQEGSAVVRDSRSGVRVRPVSASTTTDPVANERAPLALNLMGYIPRLRSVLGSHVIARHASGYSLNADHIVARAFESLVQDPAGSAPNSSIGTTAGPLVVWLSAERNRNQGFG